MSNHIDTFLKEIEEAKEKAFQAIIADDSIDKIEKLNLFEAYDLLSTDSYIIHLETELWGDEIPRTGGLYLSEELLFRSENKYETVSFSERLEVMLENAHYNNLNNPDYVEEDLSTWEVKVMSYSKDLDRRKGTIETKYVIKTGKEVVDAVYDYALKHRIWGFINNW